MDPSHIGGILLASAISGSTARVLLHPFDTLRARLQNERNPKAGTKNTSTAHLLTQMVKNEGWRSLYKGIWPALLFGLPGTMVYLTTYEKTKEKLISRGNSPENAVTHLSAGLVAECVSGLVWTPMSVLTQKLQVDSHSGSNLAKYKNSTHAIKVIYGEEGIRGFFRGYFANLSVFGPFSMIYFVVYEKLKSHYPSSYLYYVLSASIAGALAAAATAPLDVVKTRLQVQSWQSAGHYTSIAEALRRMAREEGWRVFSKGLLARVLWIAPSTGINLSIFEIIKKQFDT
eukprot:Phypoly_transcript_11666.p1 GENE.Phypoly_transcript_11666~~Phypoly_transcript_11666.p1  ORF type:complete len:287 (+),score=36.69 Phypoly_transcript_11666:278-1138(+)